jgi:hypothetical protein
MNPILNLLKTRILMDSFTRIKFHFIKCQKLKLKLKKRNQMSLDKSSLINQKIRKEELQTSKRRN